MMVSRIGPVVCLAIAALLGGCSFGHTRGTMPPPGANGQADPRQVPEFIAHVGQTDHVIGRVPSAFLLREGVGDEAMPVYADDLTQAPQQPVPDAEPLDLSPAVARGSRRLPTHLGNELSRRIGRSGRPRTLLSVLMPTVSLETTRDVGSATGRPMRRR